MKILFLYFSKSGHTKHVEQLIHGVIGGDEEEIVPKKSYSSSYGLSVVQAGLDKFRHKIPDIEPIKANLADYDVLFLGCPTWYYTIAPAMQRFIAEADLSGKRVYTFSTSGRTPKDTEADFRKALEDKGAIVCGQFHETYNYNTPNMAEEDITAWAEKVKAELKGSEK